MINLFAILDDDIRPLPIPASATSFEEMVDGLDLGIYSVLRTFDKNKFLGLDAHLARARQSMALLGWDDYELDEARLRQALHTITSSAPWPEMRVRFDVLAQPAVQIGVHTRLLVAIMPFTPIPDALYKNGVKLGFADSLNRQNPLAKTAVFAQQRRAATPAADDVYERLLLDRDGRILEGTGSNFYGVRDGVVYTAGEGILEGVTRKIILDLIRQQGIPLKLEALPVSELPTLDEAAISSSSRAIIPVVQVGAQVIGNGRPGPVSRQLLQAYNEYVAAVVETAVA